MDPALAALDFAKAGAILADMVVSYLTAGASPSDPERASEHDTEDCRSTPVATGMHLHSPVNARPSALPSGEHGSPIQLDEQGTVTRLEPGTDQGSRSRPRKIWSCSKHPHRLQDIGRRRGDGPRRCDLLSGGVKAGAFEPGLASAARTVRHHWYGRDRRRRCVRPSRFQRWPRARHEGHLRPSGVAHHSRAPPRWQAQQGV
jgi:hypothetical protein